MKKRELFHLHSLLAEVATYCKQEENITIDLEAYETQETRPASIHHPKAAHEEAVSALAKSLATSLQEEEDTDRTEPVSTTAN